MTDLSTAAAEWSEAVNAYNKIAKVISEILEDVRQIDDKTLEAYRQARNNLARTQAALISENSTDD
jgi:hypothetical protein